MKSVYIHIPFCVKKCLYCDFNSYENKEALIDEYISALIEEIKTYKLNKEIYKDKLDTIYFGGGTPSYIDEKYIKKILEVLPNADEITLEVNPGIISKEKLKIYLLSGVNRLSIGLQEANNDITKGIGRIHTKEDFYNTYKLAREAGFKNISVDLMIGLPNQTIKDLKNSIEFLLEIKPEHISCYSLIIHNNLNEIFKHVPDEETERNMYHYLVDKLTKNGYIHYEISNFSLKGMESKHNLKYWNQEEYIGLRSRCKFVYK